MATQTMPAPGAAPTLNITDKTVAISLTLGRIGNSKKVPKSKVMEKKEDATYAQAAAVEVDADKNLVGVSKKLLNSKELQAISKHDNDTVAWVKDRSVPSMFKRGIYLVMIGAVQQIDEWLQARQAERKELIQTFLNVYDQQKLDAEQHLRGVYDAGDYPPRGVVAASFILEWQYITFATPGKLKEISADFFERERAKAEGKWQEATQEAKLLLRAQMKDLVDHMLERLEPGEDGKKKVFHKTTVTNLTTFLENFSIRNVTDDAELEYLVGQARGIMDGVDPEKLRKNEVEADCLKMGFATVKKYLDSMVETAGSRKLVLEDVEEEDNPFV